MNVKTLKLSFRIRHQITVLRVPQSDKDRLLGQGQESFFDDFADEGDVGDNVFPNEDFS